MTNFEWLMTLSEEEFTDWVYDQWLHHLQYRWSSSRGGLMIWLKEERAEQTEPQTSCKTCRYGEVDEGYVRCAYYSNADRKTENSSEKPNNCEDLQDWKDRMWAEAIVTEPTISKMEQVDKDINVRSKDEEYINNLPWKEVGNGEQTDDAYFLELMGAVERDEISDAGANQAWYEYINHKDEP